jgi:hypothetical protein
MSWLGSPCQRDEMNVPISTGRDMTDDPSLPHPPGVPGARSCRDGQARSGLGKRGGRSRRVGPSLWYSLADGDLVGIGQQADRAGHRFRHCALNTLSRRARRAGHDVLQGSERQCGRDEGLCRYRQVVHEVRERACAHAMLPSRASELSDGPSPIFCYHGASDIASIMAQSCV